MLEIQDWGLIDYNYAWKKQKELVLDIQKNRNRSVLALCEHPSVITIGRNGAPDNVIVNSSFLNKLGIEVIDIDRGGDVTLHNPGQLVGYPIFNLSDYKEDLHWFLRELESIIISLVETFGIDSGRVEGLTGVWIDNYRKICAMGMHCSRWVTSHGFALNVYNNLQEFSYIVPCGITNKTVTSISQEIGAKVDMNIVKHRLVKLFEENFGNINKEILAYNAKI